MNNYDDESHQAIYCETINAKTKDLMKKTKEQKLVSKNLKKQINLNKNERLKYEGKLAKEKKKVLLQKNEIRNVEYPILLPIITNFVVVGIKNFC